MENSDATFDVLKNLEDRKWELLAVINPFHVCHCSNVTNLIYLWRNEFERLDELACDWGGTDKCVQNCRSSWETSTGRWRENMAPRKLVVKYEDRWK